MKFKINDKVATAVSPESYGTVVELRDDKWSVFVKWDQWRKYPSSPWKEEELILIYRPEDGNDILKGLL